MRLLGMPAVSKAQYRHIKSVRAQYGSEADTPDEHKWVWGPEWTDGVDYGDLPARMKGGKPARMRAGVVEEQEKAAEPMDDEADYCMPEDKLKAQGACCGEGCTNCPYEPRHTRGSTELRKEAKAPRAPLAVLMEAKLRSDKGDYAGKQALLLPLMAENADDFVVDSRGDGHPGITHVPTGFQFHFPANKIPPGVKDLAVETEKVAFVVPPLQGTWTGVRPSETVPHTSLPAAPPVPTVPPVLTPAAPAQGFQRPEVSPLPEPASFLDTTTPELPAPTPQAAQDRWQALRAHLNSKAYFGRKGSVLTGDQIVDAAIKHEVDPRLLASIVANESGWGASSLARTHNNIAGLMDNDVPLKYPTAAEGLEVSARNLRDNYVSKGRTTPERIQPKYAPIGASNDPAGNNKTWLPTVNSIYKKMPAPAPEPPATQSQPTVTPQIDNTIVNPFSKQGAAQPVPRRNTGPEAIARALAKLDLQKVEEEQQQLIRDGKVSKRDQAVKTLAIVRGLRRNNMHPSDLLVRSVPVVPPAFRPFAVTGNVFIPGDANELYKDLISYREMYAKQREMLGPEASAQASLDMYDAVKAVYGYGEPVNPKTKARGVSGFLKTIVGSSPKFGAAQRRLFSKNQDSVSRGTIIVDPELGLDEIGVPEEMAWTMYAPYVQRRLVQSGMSPGQALRHVLDRSDHATNYLNREVQQRPVIYSRAPAWHKFNVIAGRPKLIAGDAIAVNPYVTSGFNGDFDGDAQFAHIQLLRRKKQV